MKKQAGRYLPAIRAMDFQFNLQGKTISNLSAWKTALIVVVRNINDVALKQ
jgi:hypothetical protein